MAKPQTNIFIRMHPLQRLAISGTLAGVVLWFVFRTDLSVLLKMVIVWNTFCFSEVLTSWIVFFTRNPAGIRKVAKEEDGSRIAVIAFVLLASAAGLFNVGLLLIGSKGQTDNAWLTLAMGFVGMLLSWFLVHSLFTFHYARYYYSEDAEGGLEFPKEKSPDYLDFAYFSFGIGMTFQVADVTVSSSKIRRLVLLHSLLAFCLNAFVVALTVNTLSGIEI